jgi:hypothetical protein
MFGLSTRYLSNRIKVLAQMSGLRPIALVGIMSTVSQLLAQAGFATDPLHDSAQLSLIAIQETASAFPHRVRRCAEVMDDHGSALGEGFDDNDAENLIADGGDQHGNGILVKLFQAVVTGPAQEFDLGDIPCEFPDRRLIRPITGHQEIGMGIVSKYREHGVESLDLFEPSHKEEVWPPVSIPFPS